MDIEILLVNTVGANIQNEINFESAFVKNIFYSSSPKGIYLNLFYKNLRTLQNIQNENEFNDTFDLYLKDEDRELSNYYSDFQRFIKSLRLKSMSRILNLSKLKKEYKFSDKMNQRINDLIKNNIFYFIKTRGDGNCFYRAFMNNYIIKLICKNYLGNFIEILRNLQNSNSAYNLNKCKNQVNLVVKLFEHILKFSENSLEPQWIQYFCYYIIVNLYEKFDIALISILRELVYRFAKVNPDHLFEGLKLKDWVLGSYSNYSIFLKNVIRKLGEQAKDSIFSITPLMMKINLKICLVDIQDSNTNYIINYRSTSNDFNNIFFPNLDLSNEEIILLYKPGHYDGLYQKVQELEFLKKQGSMYLKYFEYLYEEKLNLGDIIKADNSFFDTFISEQEKNCSICKSTFIENAEKKINCQDHYSHVKCIESFHINQRKVNCTNCLNYLKHLKNKKTYIKPETVIKIHGKESNSVFEGDPLNENISISSKRSSYFENCSFCGEDPSIYVILSCRHCICKTCAFYINPQNFFDRSKGIYICNKDKNKKVAIIEFILSCKCRIHEIKKFINSLPSSINFFNNVDQIILWYHCPEKIDFIEPEEIKFIFGNDLFQKRSEILLRLSNNLRPLFKYSTTCDKCHFPYSYCIKLFDCFCSEKICFSCFKIENFHLNKSFSKCSKCFNIHYNYDVFIMFKCLSRSALLLNGFENYSKQIKDTYKILDQKLDMKIIELKSIPSEIDLTEEIQEPQKESKCCCIISILLFAIFVIVCCGLLYLNYLRRE